MKSVVSMSFVVACAIGLASCGGGGRGRIAFTVGLNGLPVLPPDAVYEGFAVIDGTAVSTGKFVIDPTTSPSTLVSVPLGVVLGTTQEATFGPAITQIGEAFPFIQDATAWFVSVEPAVDPVALPSGNTVMGGVFVGDTANLSNTTITDLTPPPGPQFFGLPDFVGATGVVTAITPTDGPGNDGGGLWAVTDAGGTSAGLALPFLQGTWRYALWASDGTSERLLGTFSSPLFADDDFSSAPTRGAASTGFAAPGQDFVTAATVPALVPSAMNNGDWTVEVRVEPSPDNSVAPFGLRVLSAAIPAAAVNAGGVGVGSTTLVRSVPALSVAAVTTPTSITLSAATGDAFFPSLGAVRDGRYALHVLSAGLLLPAGSFVVASDGTVSTPSGAPLGTTAGATLDGVNTGLGSAFPDPTSATTLVVTVEPQDAVSPRGAPGPILAAGDLAGGAATLTVAGSPFVPAVGDFSTIAGSFIMASPTNDAPGVAADDGFGVWFALADRRTPSLTLPFLAGGWTYAASVVNTVTGERRPIGTFRYAIGADDDASTWAGRGAVSPGLPVPGQDFVTAVPAVTLAPQTVGPLWTLRVTVEPTPRLSSTPFPITIMTGTAPAPSTSASLAVVPFSLAGSVHR